MSTNKNGQRRVLGIYPMWRGVAFAVVEGRSRLLDWGIAKLYSKNDDEFLQRIEGLIDRYAIDMLVLENPDGSRRRAVARRRVERAVSYANARQLTIRQMRWCDIRDYYGKETPREIARVITEAFPQLTPYMPPERRLWESEDGRPSLFKAVAMAALGYSSEE